VKKFSQDCKPGFVFTEHLRQAFGDMEAIIPLDGGLLRNSSSLTRKPDGRADRASLFGLAPGRVCRATSIAGSAVSSYLTVSPLPRIPVKESEAVCFLLHCPSHDRHQSCAWPLASTFAYGARTFLPKWRLPNPVQARVSFRILPLASYSRRFTPSDRPSCEIL